MSGGFGFTEAQEMLRQEVKNFAAKEMAPTIKERLKMDPSALWEAQRQMAKKMVKMGWTNLNGPAKYGGQPIDHVSIGLLVEELSKADPIPSVGGGPGSAPALSVLLGSLPEKIQDEWFPPILRAERGVSFGFTEPEAGSDAASIKTRAVRQGDYYVINGEKCPMPGGLFNEAVCISTTIDPALRHRGITMFFLPTNLPGVTRKPIPWMGNNHLFPCSMTFDDVKVPVENRIGEEGKGFYTVMGTLDWMRNGVALGQLGSATASLEEAMAWAKQRVAFGRPIVKFEGVSFMIAEHWTKVEAARLMCYRALWLKDQGKSHTKESSMAKWFSIEVAIQAINAAMVTLGWYGYSSEHLIELRLRNAMGFQFADGTRNINQMVTARELMGREALPD